MFGHTGKETRYCNQQRPKNGVLWHGMSFTLTAAKLKGSLESMIKGCLELVSAASASLWGESFCKEAWWSKTGMLLFGRNAVSLLLAFDSEMRTSFYFWWRATAGHCARLQWAQCLLKVTRHSRGWQTITWFPRTCQDSIESLVEFQQKLRLAEMSQL